MTNKIEAPLGDRETIIRIISDKYRVHMSNLNPRTKIRIKRRESKQQDNESLVEKTSTEPS